MTSKPTAADAERLSLRVTELESKLMQLRGEIEEARRSSLITITELRNTVQTLKDENERLRHRHG